MEFIDLTGAQPEWPAEATRLWVECTAMAAAERQIWRTPQFRGDEVLREVLARYLGHDPEKLLITQGVRSSVSRLKYVSRRLIIEQPTYARVPQLFSAMGFSPQSVTWNNLEQMALAEDSETTLVWITSPARNPDANRLSESCINALTSFAANGHIVVQNEIYHWYEPAASRIPGATFVGSLSKLAGGGARLGWLCQPTLSNTMPSELVGATPPGLWQRTWARFIQLGGLELLRQACIEIALTARAAFCQEIRDMLEISPNLPAGPFLAIKVGGNWGEDMVASWFRQQGILVGPGGDFAFPQPGVRLCFTGITPDQAIEAATRLREQMMKDRSFNLCWVMF